MCYALSMIFPCIHNCAVHREDSTQTSSTSQELSHHHLLWQNLQKISTMILLKRGYHISKPSRKSLIHWLRRQEETEDLFNREKKSQKTNIILPSAGNDEWQVEQDRTLTEFYMMRTSITDSMKITENGEVFTGNPHTNRYWQQPCNYPWFHARNEHPEKRGAPYLMLR